MLGGAPDSSLSSPLNNALPVPTQFLIGGAANPTSSQNSNLRINDESAHPLLRLQPDTWNNIPVCLVKAVKTLIEASISTDQRMRNVHGQTDNNVRKVASQVQKVEKDLIKKED